MNLCIQGPRIRPRRSNQSWCAHPRVFWTSDLASLTPQCRSRGHTSTRPTPTFGIRLKVTSKASSNQGSNSSTTVECTPHDREVVCVKSSQVLGFFLSFIWSALHPELRSFTEVKHYWFSYFKNMLNSADLGKLSSIVRFEQKGFI